MVLKEARTHSSQPEVCTRPPIDWQMWTPPAPPAPKLRHRDKHRQAETEIRHICKHCQEDYTVDAQRKDSYIQSDKRLQGCCCCFFLQVVPLTETSCIVNRPLAFLYATGGLQFSFYSVHSVSNTVLGVRSQGDGGDTAWTRGILRCLKSNVYFIGTFCTSVGSGGGVGFVS